MKVDFPKWATCLFEPSRFKAIYGGRGSSKSWSMATALVSKARRNQELILCAREIQLSIKDSSKRVIENAIERLGWQDLFEIQRDVIRSRETGSEFIFSGLKDGADKLKSYEGITIAWVEEANTVSQKSIDTLHPTIRRPNSEIWYTFNPALPTDPVYQMFVEGEVPPNSIVRKVNYCNNPWFPDVLREQMEYDRKNDPDKHRHVWEGFPVLHSEAQIFYGRWKVAPVPDPPKDVCFYHGADWGFANDPSVLVRCWIDAKENRLYVDRAVYGYHVDVIDTPALFNRVEGAGAWTIIADSARPESISHMQRHGFPKMLASRKGKNSIEDGIGYIRNFETVIAPELKELIDEFNLYSYKVDERTGMITPRIVDKYNHGIDALRYALEPAMRKAKTPKLRVSR